MKRALAGLAAAAALGACAPTEGGVGSQTALAPAQPVGEPVDCINTNEIRDTRALDDRTIDFRLKSGRIYRNTLENSCPGLRQQAFTYQARVSRLCSIDTITVLGNSPGIPGPTCGLGTFQQVSAETR